MVRMCFPCAPGSSFWAHNSQIVEPFQTMARSQSRNDMLLVPQMPKLKRSTIADLLPPHTLSILGHIEKRNVVAFGTPAIKPTTP